MADIFDEKTRSSIMSKIKSSRTRPERIMKNHLDCRIFRYQPKIFGKPDFGNKTRRFAVFVDGCFWHKCLRCYREPKSKREFWVPKLERNVKRDREVSRKLRKMGYKVIRVWEHDVLMNPSKCSKIIYKSLGMTRWADEKR